MAFRREVPPLEKLGLKYVTKAGRVLERVINEDTIARTHRISEPSKTRTHKVKQELIRAILQTGRVTDATLPDAFFHESMTRLEMIGSKISIVFIERLSRICTKLHTVNFSGCFRLTDDAIEVLLRNCPDMKEVNLENCRKLTDLTLDHLRKHAPKLQAIDIGGNFNMTVHGIAKLIERHPNHSKFTRVHISGHAINDQMLKTITAKCRKLHSLAIGYCSVSDEAIIALLTKRTNISRLLLHWNTGITDQVLHFIASSGKNIQDLSLCGVKSITADAILSTISAKMDLTAFPSDALSAPAVAPPSSQGEHGADEAKEPERKRLKKIDVRYTAVTKDHAAIIKDRFPDLHAVY